MRYREIFEYKKSDVIMTPASDVGAADLFKEKGKQEAKLDKPKEPTAKEKETVRSAANFDAMSGKVIPNQT